MIARRNLLAAGLALVAAPAFALDPGTASGHFARDGQKVQFRHAIALSQDNAEGLLDGGPQIRVVLSDVEVPISAVYGLVFPPVLREAHKDAVHGVILEFSPKDPTAMHVTVLAKPEEAGNSLTNLSLSNSSGVFKRLEVSATRVSGDYDGGEDSDFKFSFSAPVFTDAVQADLKGADAQKSEQVRVLLARALAVQRSDLPAALALSSQGSDLRGISPAELKGAAGMAAEMIRDIRAIKRVVVRRETAVALLSQGSWSSLVLEDGAWKVAD
ncbi:MAG: hypothetical protein JWQ29_2627 [Phenylobacterium sp.]|nr:hypothetical protein [Phenylobacterium sp.]